MYNQNIVFPQHQMNFTYSDKSVFQENVNAQKECNIELGFQNEVDGPI